MRIVEQYSHLNGYEYLLVHHPDLWSEIAGVIANVDAAAARTKVSKEKRMEGKALYSPIALNAEFKSLLKAEGWQDQRVTYYVTGDEKLARQTMDLKADDQRKAILAANQVPIPSYNQTDFVKDRVAVEVQFGKYAFVAYDLFVKHMAFYARDEIDCGIEILPMKSMQSQMSSGPSYFEGEVYNVYRQGRGVPAVPLVVVGVAE